jgi:hypothetical protein
LRWDFARLGLDLDQVGAGIPWRAASDLISEAARDTGSHLFADLTGARWPASFADLAVIQVANGLGGNIPWPHDHATTPEAPDPALTAWYETNNAFR